MQLGTIGLGRMGANMARRLLAAGHRKGLFAPTGVGAACMRVRVGNAIGVGLTEAVLRGDREMPTRTERTHQVTQIEVILETSHADFTRAFESLLGRMPVGALDDLPLLSREAARARLASFVGPLDFALFQKIDHGRIVTTLTGRPCEATTYVFGNALIAIEMTKHVARAGLYVPLRLFVEAVASDRVRVTYDLPSSLMAPFGSADVNKVAHRLDEKVERLLDLRDRWPSAAAVQP